jgi:hypothetical protein
MISLQRENEQLVDDGKKQKRKKLYTFAELYQHMERQGGYLTRDVHVRRERRHRNGQS